MTGINCFVILIVGDVGIYNRPKRLNSSIKIVINIVVEDIEKSLGISVVRRKDS